jgi:Cu/Ag efflux protein CusF
MNFVNFNQKGTAMSKYLLIASIISAAFALPDAMAQTGATIVDKGPGVATAAQTVKVTATIIAIDPATRVITLKDPQGKEVALTAGPEVKNFAQMKVGDQVTAGYVEALTLELKKGGGKTVARTEQAGSAAAKPGERPAGAVGRQVTIVADVVAIDAATQTITLRGPQRTVDLKVRDPEQFKLIAKGDQVEATYTEAVAIEVTPTGKK